MALKSPSKITCVKGEEFTKIRDQFRLLAYSVLDEAISRQKLYHELTELGEKVMIKFAGMDAERKYFKKELAKAQGMLEKMEGELEITKAALDFIKDDNLELEAEDGAEKPIEILEGEMELELETDGAMMGHDC